MAQLQANITLKAEDEVQVGITLRHSPYPEIQELSNKQTKELITMLFKDYLARLRTQTSLTRQITDLEDKINHEQDKTNRDKLIVEIAELECNLDVEQKRGMTSWDAHLRLIGPVDRNIFSELVFAYELAIKGQLDRELYELSENLRLTEVFRNMTAPIEEKMKTLLQTIPYIIQQLLTSKVISAVPNDKTIEQYKGNLPEGASLFCIDSHGIVAFPKDYYNSNEIIYLVLKPINST